MFNVISVTEDYYLNSRLKGFFSSSTDCMYHFFDNSASAIDFAEESDIAVAIISLNMSVMNGEEVSQTLYDMHNNILFIFLFDEQDIYKAVELFNYYDDSSILDINNLNLDRLRTTVDRMINKSSCEDKLNKAIDYYRDKENTYKLSMDDMSLVLNERINGYKDISHLYSLSNDFLIKSNKTDCKFNVQKFYDKYLYSYIDLNLIESESVNTIFDDLEVKYNNPSDFHFYSFENDSVRICKEDINGIYFSIDYISELINEFFVKYRVKINLCSGERGYSADILLDSGLASCSTDDKEVFYKISVNSLTCLCDKMEHATKDGIFRFRLFFVKSKEDGK